MAFLHGKKAKFSVDNSSGSLVDISAYCNSVQMPRNIETAETTTFGATGNAKTYITGLVDGTISIAGNFDANGASSVDAVLSGINGQDATVSFEYQMSNASVSATNPKYTGEAIMTKYEVSTPVGGVVTFSAEFQISGAVTRATS